MGILLGQFGLHVVLGLVTLIIERLLVNVFAYWTLSVHLSNTPDFPSTPKYSGWKCAFFNLGLLLLNEKSYEEFVVPEFYISAICVLTADSCVFWLMEVNEHCKMYHVYKDFNGLLVMCQVIVAAAAIVFYLNPTDDYFFIHSFIYLSSMILRKSFFLFLL